MLRAAGLRTPGCGISAAPAAAGTEGTEAAARRHGLWRAQQGRQWLPPAAAAAVSVGARRHAQVREMRMLVAVGVTAVVAFVARHFLRSFRETLRKQKQQQQQQEEEEGEKDKGERRMLTVAGAEQTAGQAGAGAARVCGLGVDVGSWAGKVAVMKGWQVEDVHVLRMPAGLTSVAAGSAGEGAGVGASAGRAVEPVPYGYKGLPMFFRRDGGEGEDGEEDGGNKYSVGEEVRRHRVEDAVYVNEETGEVGTRDLVFGTHPFLLYPRCANASMRRFVKKELPFSLFGAAEGGLGPAVQWGAGGERKDILYFTGEMVRHLVDAATRKHPEIHGVSAGIAIPSFWRNENIGPVLDAYVEGGASTAPTDLVPVTDSVAATVAAVEDGYIPPTPPDMDTPRRILVVDVGGFLTQVSSVTVHPPPPPPRRVSATGKDDSTRAHGVDNDKDDDDDVDTDDEIEHVQRLGVRATSPTCTRSIPIMECSGERSTMLIAQALGMDKFGSADERQLVFNEAEKVKMHFMQGNLSECTVQLPPQPDEMDMDEDGVMEVDFMRMEVSAEQCERWIGAAFRPVLEAVERVLVPPASDMDDPSDRGTLADTTHVLLCGGAARLPGLVPMLQHKLALLVPGVQLICPPHASELVARGAALVHAGANQDATASR